MKRIYNLGTIAWNGAGGVHTMHLSPIPDGIHGDQYRVTHFLLHCRADVTTGAGGGYTGAELLEWISNISLKAASHSFTNLNGRELFRLLEYRGEEATTLPPNVAANQTNDINYVQLAIPMEDLRAIEPQDYVVPASYFNDGVLNVTLGVPLINANSTMQAFNMDVWAMVERKNEVQIPALPIIAASPTTMFNQLPAGVYSDLFILADKDAFSAAALFNLIILKAAGEDIHGAVTPEAVIKAYCVDRMRDWTACGGYSWEEDYASQKWLPLIWQAFNPNSNRGSQLVDTMGESLSFDFNGTETAPNLVYRYFEGLTDENARRGLAKMGATDPSAMIVKRKTKSKQPITTQATRVMPGLKVLPAKVLGGKTDAALGKLAPRFSLQPKKFTFAE